MRNNSWKIKFLISLLLWASVVAKAETIHLSPKIHVQASAVPAIELKTLLPYIQPFLAKAWVVDADAINHIPSVQALATDHLTAINGDKFYASGLKLADRKDYAIVRLGKAYTDPTTEQLLGYEANFIGSATVWQSGEPATLTATKITEPVQVGDALLADDKLDLAQLSLITAAVPGLSGQIVSLLGNSTLGAKFSVVAINRGSRVALQPGNLLTIYAPARWLTDPKTGKKIALPKVAIGQLWVFRVFPQLSFGLVVTANRPVTRGDYIASS